MPRNVDYYFSLLSPWAYIGHAHFMTLAKRYGLSVVFKPVVLTELFGETGGLPLAKRHPVRQRYRDIELQRWRAKRGLDFKLRPASWPFDPALADRFVIAIALAGEDPRPFLARAFPAVWERELNLADEATIAALAREAGLDPAPLLASAKDDASEAVYRRNREDAVAAGVFGSPAYVVEGEVFWGQDRLDLLEDMLASGRPPYSAGAA